MLQDTLGAAFDFVKEGSAKARICEFVEFCGFIQLASGEPMKGGALHSLELRPRFPKDLIGRIRRLNIRIHLRISSLGFFGPKLSIFFRR
jgi:hypothetical protein